MRIKKTTVFLSLVVMAAMLLAACGGEEGTSTSVPSTDVPPVTVEATSTDDALAGTDTAPTLDTTPGVPVTGEDSPSRLSVLLDYDVWNQNGEQVGDVEDMILDLDNSRISYVIVGTGGFLGIGEKEVLVPWNSLQVHPETGDVVGAPENAFILLADQETLENAPDVDINDVMPDWGTPANNWDADIRNFWETGVLPTSTNTPAADATAVPEMTATVNPGTTDQGQAMELQGVMLASDVLGSFITIGVDGQVQGQVDATAAPDATPQVDVTPTLSTGTGTTGLNDTQAMVDDVIVDPDTGEIQYLVLDVAFEDGQRWVPVPLRFIQWDPTNEYFVVRVDSAALQDAPFFEAGEYPVMTGDNWDSDYNSYWQNR
jgi:sporulation protein YlmC with PRC-barrel domain